MLACKRIFGFLCISNRHKKVKIKKKMSNPVFFFEQKFNKGSSKILKNRFSLFIFTFLCRLLMQRNPKIRLKASIQTIFSTDQVQYEYILQRWAKKNELYFFQRKFIFFELQKQNFECSVHEVCCRNVHSLPLKFTKRNKKLHRSKFIC